MSTITKDKNFLVFTNNQNRTYRFNINNGIFYSTQNKPLKNAPSGFATYVDNFGESTVLSYMRRKHLSNDIPYHDMSKFADVLTVCDKLDSIGYNNPNYHDLYDELLIFVGNHFKNFAKEFRQNENLTVYQYFDNFGKKYYLNQLGLKVNEYYTDNILNTIYDWRKIFSAEQAKLVAYYLSRGIWDFFNDENNRYNRVHSNLFEDFFNWCEVIGHKPTKDDFYRQYLTVKKNYFANKKTYDDISIKLHLDKHNDIWKFEDDEFCIVVPQSVDDFQLEGDAQHNCVYTMYLERVVKRQTNVVFVRRKSDPTKSYITCEVDNNGNIRQFLLRFNTRVMKDTKEYKFFNDFQNFINDNWNK